METQELVEKYFRPGRLPHIWCPGCGNGIVTGAIVKAVDKLGLNQDETVVVSGIGCSSRSSGYLDFNTVHSAHGRALPVATGVKLSEPRLKVIVCTGDGRLVEVQGTAEGEPFDRDQLAALVDLGQAGCATLATLQAQALQDER